MNGYNTNYKVEVHITNFDEIQVISFAGDVYNSIFDRINDHSFMLNYLTHSSCPYYQALLF